MRILIVAIVAIFLTACKTEQPDNMDVAKSFAVCHDNGGPYTLQRYSFIMQLHAVVVCKDGVQKKFEMDEWNNITGELVLEYYEKLDSEEGV